MYITCRFRFSTGNDSDNEIELYDSKEKNLFKNISYTTILKGQLRGSRGQLRGLGVS